MRFTSPNELGQLSVQVHTITKVRHIWHAVRPSNEKSKFAADVLIRGVSQVFAQARGLVLLPLISIFAKERDSYTIRKSVVTIEKLIFDSVNSMSLQE
jgi:hypothetical protein